MADDEYLRDTVNGLVSEIDFIKNSLSELYQAVSQLTDEKDPSITRLEEAVNNDRNILFGLQDELIQNTTKLDMLLNQAKFINDAEGKYFLLEMKLNFIMNKLGLKNNEEKELLQ